MDSPVTLREPAETPSLRSDSPVTAREPAVTAPLTYSALNTNATTALAGAEARYRGIPKTTLFASAGVETDTNGRLRALDVTGPDGSDVQGAPFNPNKGYDEW